ncbi:MAG: electron transfer flavoprotein subunit beta [Candidatus Marinimicrobia bacterium]|nr:electron transfer flavoprotein subunit beta [Candidatus Neomarinimicrobiota bacterium]|tara:strand:+ start:3450 stop:4223 length:774 start_codon:yes stop_codon:yes gene_type:complete
MKIAVLVKQVFDKDSNINISADGSLSNREDLTLSTNECDSYALEEALQIKEKIGGEVIILSVGNDSVLSVIKDGLAKGADRGLHIKIDNEEKLDALELSKLIQAALKNENVDMVFSGLQSDDKGFGQTGILLAELMNLSHASLVMGTEIQNDSTIRIKRELEAGWFQWVDLSLPTSLTIQSGINKPRYSSLRGIMMMKKKKIDTKTIEDLGFELSQKTKVVKMYVPEKTKETVYIDGSVNEIVDQLIDKFANDIKVL